MKYIAQSKMRNGRMYFQTETTTTTPRHGVRRLGPVIPIVAKH
jgi:hypothetical protein